MQKPPSHTLSTDTPTAPDKANTAGRDARLDGPHLLLHTQYPDVHRLSHYMAAGGYKALHKVLGKVSPAEVVEWLAISGLSGRGGACQPVAKKWRRVADVPGQRYVIANGDESEPGTFKDRELMETNPHQVIEGMILTGYTVAATRGYIYVRHGYPIAMERFKQALAEAYDAGILGTDILGTGVALDLQLFPSTGGYICGEQTALIETIEGKPPVPRPKPPYPTVVGLWGRPTVVQNVETLASIPVVINLGPERFASIGCATSPGPKIYSVSGHVETPGNYEVSTGVTLRELLQMAGGMRAGMQFKAALPGGASSDFIVADHLDVPLAVGPLSEVGKNFGTGGVLVLGSGTCMVSAAESLMRFFRDESCGKCTPCREGTRMMYDWLHALETGRGSEAEVNALRQVSTNVPGTCCCALIDGACAPLISAMEHFPEEFHYHGSHGHCLEGYCTVDVNREFN